jgi:hypothetical protein
MHKIFVNITRTMSHSFTSSSHLGPLHPPTHRHSRSWPNPGSEHLPSCWHGVARQRSTYTSHFRPVKCSAHAQWKSLTSSRHVPLFAQETPWQSSIFWSQLGPENVFNAFQLVKQSITVSQGIRKCPDREPKYGRFIHRGLQLGGRGG